jgi:hypothetical protein
MQTKKHPIEVPKELLWDYKKPWRSIAETLENRRFFPSSNNYLLPWWEGLPAHRQGLRGEGHRASFVGASVVCAGVRIVGND